MITLAALVAVGVTTRLGFWQLSRAAEKEARSSAVDAQSALPAVDAAALRAGADQPQALLYRRAHLRGTWAAKSLVFLENRPMDGRVGFVVVMPFVLEGGGALVVQRGWVPRGFEDRTLVPAIATPSGVVEVEGRLAPPPSSLYALGTATAGTIRQNLALPQFRVETGLPLMSVTLQQTGSSADGLLRDWPVADLGLQRNYGYAFQWFGMAALVALLYLWFQIVRPFIQRPKDVTPHV